MKILSETLHPQPQPQKRQESEMWSIRGDTEVMRSRASCAQPTPHPRDTYSASQPFLHHCCSFWVFFARRPRRRLQVGQHCCVASISWCCRGGDRLGVSPAPSIPGAMAWGTASPILSLRFFSCAMGVRAISRDRRERQGAGCSEVISERPPPSRALPSPPHKEEKALWAHYIKHCHQRSLTHLCVSCPHL